MSGEHQKNHDKKEKKVMRKKVVIEEFKKDLPGMTDEEILEMIRRSVWETDHAEIEFVD